MDFPLISFSILPGNLTEANLAGIIPITFESIIIYEYIKILNNIFVLINKRFMFTKGLIFRALMISLSMCNIQVTQAQGIQDSFFLYSDAGNQSYFDYKVNKNQTLYQLSKTFRVSTDTINFSNKEILDKGLKEHGVLKIPINKYNIQSNKSNPPDSCIAFYYRVKKGESLFQIAKRKFEIDLKILLQLNNIKSATLREGTTLLLGYYPLNCSTHLSAQISNPKINEEPLQEPIETALLTRQSRGVAISQYDQLGSGRLFALHNSAIMDSNIEIENPITNRKVYAKVIGRIPPIYEKEVQIIVSAEAARLLGAVDKRFFVSIRYR
jgi:LysM repeat protein